MVSVRFIASQDWRQSLTHSVFKGFGVSSTSIFWIGDCLIKIGHVLEVLLSTKSTFLGSQACRVLTKKSLSAPVPFFWWFWTWKTSQSEGKIKGFSRGTTCAVRGSVHRQFTHAKLIGGHANFVFSGASWMSDLNIFFDILEPLFMNAIRWQ